MTVPTASLSTLNRADGSATYSANGFTVVGAVNGPIEVQRRDERPEEATIEVNVRPAVGVGSTKERHLETLIHSTLRRIILTHAFPRSLIQLTLQIVSSSEQSNGDFASSDLLVLPALLQTAMLTLLSSSLPLDTTFTCVALAISSGKTVNILDLIGKSLDIAESVHVFAFTPAGQLLLAESEGSFMVEQWEAVHNRAKELCLSEPVDASGDRMQVEGQAQGVGMKQWLQDTVQRQVDKDQAWKT